MTKHTQDFSINISYAITMMKRDGVGKIVIQTFKFKVMCVHTEAGVHGRRRRRRRGVDVHHWTTQSVKVKVEELQTHQEEAGLVLQGRGGHHRGGRGGRTRTRGATILRSSGPDGCQLETEQLLSLLTTLLCATKLSTRLQFYWTQLVSSY